MASHGGPSRIVVVIVARVATVVLPTACSAGGPGTVTPGTPSGAAVSPAPVRPTQPAPGTTAPNASATTPAVTPHSPSASPAPSFNVPDAAYLRDSVSLATFSVVLDHEDPQFGLISLGIPTVGLLWTTSPVTVDALANGSIEVNYKGPAELDRSAKLDLDFGILSQRSGSSDSVEMTVRASIGPNHRTGTVAMTVAGHRRAITDGAPTQSAQETLDTLVIATRNEDWAHTYELASSTITRSVTEAEWVANMQTGLVSYGHVVDATAGVLTYRSDAYLDSAAAPFSITVEKDGARRELDYTVSLVWEDGTWRVANTTPPPPP